MRPVQKEVPKIYGVKKKVSTQRGECSRELPTAAEGRRVQTGAQERPDFRKKLKGVPRLRHRYQKTRREIRQGSRGGGRWSKSQDLRVSFNVRH